MLTIINRIAMPFKRVLARRYDSEDPVESIFDVLEMIWKNSTNLMTGYQAGGLVFKVSNCLSKPLCHHGIHICTYPSGTDLLNPPVLAIEICKEGKIQVLH